MFSLDIIHALKRSSVSRLSAVCVLDLCSSTNDYLLSRKLPPKTKFNLCVAARQYAGRGRRAKSWSSDHNGVYLSVSWQASPGIKTDGWLPLMTAVRLAEKLHALGVSEIGVKWPNDLYYKSAKLAGILLEYSGNLVVMGIGLNIATPLDAVSKPDASWTGLEQTGIVVPSYVDLVAMAVDTALAVDERVGIAERKRRFSTFDMLYNQSVEIDDQGTKILGIALGIDEKAHLLVDSDGQVDIYNYGEISVRNDRITDRCRQQPL